MAGFWMGDGKEKSAEGWSLYLTMQDMTLSHVLLADCSVLSLLPDEISLFDLHLITCTLVTSLFLTHTHPSGLRASLGEALVKVQKHP
jgi:hypothetical protein